MLKYQKNNRPHLFTKKVTCLLSIITLFVFPGFLSGEDLKDEWAARQIYLENCAACHGFDRMGFIGVSLIPSNLTPLSQAAIRSLMRHGISDTLMPSWSCRLTMKQLRQLSRYLKEMPAETIKKIQVRADGELEVLENTTFPNDGKRLDRGRSLFDKYCMGCHHPQIEAFGPSYRDIANKRDISAIMGQIKFPYTNSRFLGYTDQTMPMFDLTDNEIRDLGAYVYHFRNSR